VKKKIDSFLKYNISRIRRAEQFDQQKADFLFKIIPLLLHVNHPEIPGYVDDENCPCGIFGLLPEKKISQQLYQERFPLAPPLAELQHFSASPAAVQSLKTLGSIGTLAQSDKSDCDFWVSVHEEALGRQGMALLQKKCHFVEKWLLDFGIEVHFFLMDIAQTREDSFESLAEEESAGSSLKLLLKDELFRTHILIAGKALLWWLIPPGLNEEQYRESARRLLQEGRINSEQFIDLGYISDIPKAEIFGACLWQMNKALDSPFKSVIKFAYLELLLSREQKSLPLFSDRIKCLITYPEKLPEEQRTELTLEEVDPYLLLARDIITYYRNLRADPARAELICRCLFLKTLEGMESQQQHQAENKTKNVLQLMKKWQLLPGDYAQLLDLAQWRHRQLESLGNAVHRYLIDTYKRLRKIFRKFQDNEKLTITERDIAVLGRKLFTFYEKKPDKVDYLRSISREAMRQDHITIHVTSLKGQNTYIAFQGSHDSRSLQKNVDMIIRRGNNIVPLLVWLWINGILHTDTTLHLSSNLFTIALPDLQEMVRALDTFMPHIDFAHISGQQLLQPERIINALVIVNLERLPVKGSKKLLSTLVATNSYGEFFVHDNDTLAQLKNTLAQLLSKHYVSRWKNNLHFFIPQQPELHLIQSMLGI